jgi:hypothetical protein
MAWNNIAAELLPAGVAQTILESASAESVVLRLANIVVMPEGTMSIPTVSVVPKAEFVALGGRVASVVNVRVGDVGDGGDLFGGDQPLRRPLDRGERLAARRSAAAAATSSSTASADVRRPSFTEAASRRSSSRPCEPDGSSESWPQAAPPT